MPVRGVVRRMECRIVRAKTDRTLVVRRDTLTGDDVKALRFCKKVLKLRTEVMFDTLDAGWLRRNSTLVDAVSLPFSALKEWDRVKCDAHLARAEGFDVCVRTMVSPANWEESLDTQMIMLDPLRWTVSRHPTTSARQFYKFATTNRRAMNETGLVEVVWEGELELPQLLPRKCRRRSMLSHFLD